MPMRADAFVLFAINRKQQLKRRDRIKTIPVQKKAKSDYHIEVSLPFVPRHTDEFIGAKAKILQL